MRLCTFRKIQGWTTKNYQRHDGHSCANSPSARYYSTSQLPWQGSAPPSEGTSHPPMTPRSPDAKCGSTPVRHVSWAGAEGITRGTRIEKPNGDCAHQRANRKSPRAIATMTSHREAAQPQKPRDRRKQQLAQQQRLHMREDQPQRSQQTAHNCKLRFAFG